jgi:hypothetical protein
MLRKNICHDKTIESVSSRLCTLTEFCNLEEIFLIILFVCDQSAVELAIHNVHDRYILIMHILDTDSIVILSMRWFRCFTSFGTLMFTTSIVAAIFFKKNVHAV